jgi:hypothetical protein
MVSKGKEKTKGEEKKLEEIYRAFQKGEPTLYYM